MKACEGLLIVASPDVLATIPQAGFSADGPGPSLFASQSEDPIPLDLLAAAKVIVVEVDQASPASIERLTELGRIFPNLPRIAAIADASVPLMRTLMHEGVADIVSLPFRIEEVLDVAARTIELARQQATQQAGLAPVISVLGSTGSSGSTSIATHLAVSLAEQLEGKRRLALVDLDLQSGMVADYLGIAGAGSVLDLLQANERLDGDLLRSIERTGQAKVAVYAAPDKIEPIESVDTDQVLRVLTMMRQQHSGLVLDLPACWTNWSLSAVSMSELIIIVVELNVNSLRQAKRQLQLFSEVGIDPKKVGIVVNRVERRLFGSIDLSDVDQTLHSQVLGTVARDDQYLASAQTQGLLVQQVSRKSKFNADVNVIATDLLGRLAFQEN